MLTTLLTISVLMSVLFISMNHPLSAGMILLINTITISLITGNLNQNFWFSYILFLILIGGMLILFMYMTSIASNEKFKTNPMMVMIIMPAPLIAWTINKTIKSTIMNNETLMFNEQISMNSSLIKYINLPLSGTLIFLMIYLLLALIATVKITSFKQGSVRQMN
uniref:NADH-ubiquinone oxidoreductase chain 6 n=1 Tax=Gonocephalum sp. MT-2015-Zz052324 TaxID=1874194 RepID=A0A7R5Y7S0_9CUCU|nr:NADH dehydrogenase subunit 6 [Gonocephalum sp. MT-2015-Zz052324]ANT72394.1 NADH dehydrogenase subunit 6 [Gonocephalum sp. MT-2015-Zz052324]